MVSYFHYSYSNSHIYYNGSILDLPPHVQTNYSAKVGGLKSWIKITDNSLKSVNVDNRQLKGAALQDKY